MKRLRGNLCVLTCETDKRNNDSCFSSSLSTAIEPPCGDRVDADRCADEQHDGENIRPLLRCAHAGSAGAGQHRRGIA